MLGLGKCWCMCLYTVHRSNLAPSDHLFPSSLYFSPSECGRRKVVVGATEEGWESPKLICCLFRGGSVC